MASIKSKNEHSNLDEIYEDLKNRLKGAKKGAGLKFSELPLDSLIEYLTNIGVPTSGIDHAVKYVTNKFNGVVNSPKNETASVEQIIEHKHPFVETKHKPRKTVFGKIVKITN